METSYNYPRRRVRRALGQARRDASAPGAFTLLETLVVMSLISLLLAILMPALAQARREMNKLKCASNLRSLTLHFQLFAENNTEQGQGDSTSLGRSRFFMNDYQDSLYGIDEFWDLGQASTGRLQARSALMLCPAGPGQLTKRRGYPCGRESIMPAQDVTLAVNMRLYRSVLEIAGTSVLAPVALTRVRSSVLNHPYVPLVMDVDGSEAAARGLEPFYTAPPLPDTDDPYTDGRYWMPSTRHGGKTNVAFVGGHVLSSAEPERQRWNWEYQADIGR